MVKVIIFESKPGKAKKYKFTLQRSGQFKSSGAGGLYPRNKFNHENPVLDAKVDGKRYVIGDNHKELGGNITRMNLSNGGLMIHCGTKNVLIDTDTTETPSAPKKDYEVEFKKHLFDNAGNFINEEDVRLGEDLKFCCAVQVIGGFGGNRPTTLEQYIENESDNFIDNIDNDEYDDNEKQINKAINAVKKTLKSDDFWVELARAVLQKNLSNDTTWVATINKKDQPVWYQAFQTIEDIEYESEDFNKDRLVMYRHLV